MKIKNSVKIIALSAVLSTLFVGCGGSSDSSTTPPPAALTGTFVDAPVQGLAYKTATQSGFTDASGQFKYKAGETVEFKLGNLSLGKGTAGALVTPYTISDNNDTATNIALVLQNFDGNRSNTATLDLSKLKDYNFSASDFNLSASDVESKITTLLSTGSFQSLVDENNNSTITKTEVKTKMDDYIDTNSIEFDKKFTQAYLDTHDFYQIDTPDQGGNQRVRYRDGQRQIVGDGDTSATGGFNATFDNPSNFYTTPFELKDGKIIMTFSDQGGSLKVSTKITNITATSITTLGTVLESTISKYPVGMTKTEILYTNKTAAEAALSN